MSSAKSARALRGLRVLLVEDEALVAMLLEDMLHELGCIVIGPAARLDEAQNLLDLDEVDAAVLDINVAGQKVFPVADRLETSGVPYIFASGYGEAGLDDRHRTRQVVQKPYRQEMIERALVREVTGG